MDKRTVAFFVMVVLWMQAVVCANPTGIDLLTEEYHVWGNVRHKSGPYVDVYDIVRDSPVSGSVYGCHSSIPHGIREGYCSSAAET